MKTSLSIVKKIIILSVIALVYITVWKSFQAVIFNSTTNIESVISSEKISTELVREHFLHYRIIDSRVERMIRLKAPFGLFFFLALVMIILFSLPNQSLTYLFFFSIDFRFTVNFIIQYRVKVWASFLHSIRLFYTIFQSSDYSINPSLLLHFLQKFSPKIVTSAHD